MKDNANKALHLSEKTLRVFSAGELNVRQRENSTLTLDFALPYIYNVVMSELRFEWDEKKNKENQRKHKVSFEEAQTVFFDENAVEFYDDPHSKSEGRFLLLGVSAKLRVLMICHCLREEESVIRIISARKATKNEKREYPW